MAPRSSLDYEAAPEAFLSRPVRKRRRWPIPVGILVLALSVCAWIVASDRGGRGTPPRHSANAATLAYQSAVDAGAEEWAPLELEDAELRLETSRHEMLRQEGRLPFFRDFRAARDGFRFADSLSRVTEKLARTRRQEAADHARAQLGEIQAAQLQLKSLHYRVRPDAADARSLRRATQLLRDAEAAYANEKFAEARALAARAEVVLDEARGSALSVASRFVDTELVERWRSWVQETLAWSRRTGDYAIVVYKEKNKLALYRGGREVRTFHADMGSNKARDKVRAGDEATPEGKYKITVRKDVGHSRYHRALEINYPNSDDLARFARLKKEGAVPRGASPGGLIEIHGEGGRGQDWTRGCVALSNRDMDELFKHAKVGTPVTIVGGDGQDGIFSRLLQKGDPGDGFDRN
jgi:hypothetical protein